MDLSGAVIEILTPENLPWISGSGHFDRALHTMGISMRSTFSFPRDLRWMMATAWEKNCLKEILPTALCVASDTLAVGVLQALNEGNIQIPEQVAVFSINDVNIAKYLSPPLTTIHIDIPCICETALDLLRNRVLYGGRVTKLVFVNGIPVFRKSC